MSALSMTVHVGADGKVTRGGKVPHRAANIHGDHRSVASPPRSAAPSFFRHDSGVPQGVDQSITLPHDCGNHLEF